jgi:hypothetical protein
LDRRDKSSSSARFLVISKRRVSSRPGALKLASGARQLRDLRAQLQNPEGQRGIIHPLLSAMSRSRFAMKRTRFGQQSHQPLRCRRAVEVGRDQLFDFRLSRPHVAPEVEGGCNISSLGAGARSTHLRLFPTFLTALFPAARRLQQIVLAHGRGNGETEAIAQELLAAFERVDKLHEYGLKGRRLSVCVLHGRRGLGLIVLSLN